MTAALAIGGGLTLVAAALCHNQRSMQPMPNADIKAKPLVISVKGSDNFHYELACRCGQCELLDCRDDKESRQGEMRFGQQGKDTGLGCAITQSNDYEPQYIVRCTCGKCRLWNVTDLHDNPDYCGWSKADDNQSSITKHRQYDTIMQKVFDPATIEEDVIEHKYRQAISETPGLVLGNPLNPEPWVCRAEIRRCPCENRRTCRSCSRYYGFLFEQYRQGSPGHLRRIDLALKEVNRDCRRAAWCKDGNVAHGDCAECTARNDFISLQFSQQLQRKKETKEAKTDVVE